MGAWRFPQHVEVGPGSVSRLGELLERRGARRVLVISDPGVERSGALDAVIRPLARCGIATGTWTAIAGEPDVRTVEAAVSAVGGQVPDWIVGAGGGAAMDVAKATAALVPDGGSLRDHWGMDTFAHDPLPLVLVPTTAGTGSEVSQFAVITDEADGVKRVSGGLSLLPAIAVVDADLTLTLPARETADSGMDALTHAVESYIGRAADHLSEPLSLRAVELVARFLPRAYHHPEDREARAGMMLAATTAGIAFNAAGLGAVHALGYPLDTRCGVRHGRSNAVMLAPVLRLFEPECRERLHVLARAAGATSFVAWLDELLASLQISPRLRDHGVAKDQARALGREGWETGQRLLGNSPHLLTVEEAEEIFVNAW